MQKGREENTKFSKILPNNQIMTACCIKLWVQEMTMNKKLTMIGLILNVFDSYCILTISFVPLTHIESVQS